LWLFDTSKEDLRLLLDLNADEVASLAGYTAPPPQWSADGRLIYFPSAHEAHVSLACISVDGPAIVRHVIKGDAAVVFPTLSAAANRLAYGLSSWDCAGAIEIFEVESGTRRRLFTMDSERVSQLCAGRIEERHFRTPSGEQRQGWLLLPDGDNGPAPLLIDIHGGPHSFHPNAFPRFAMWYALVHRGWAVLLLNAVGSSSFGKDFARRLRGNWGQIDIPEHLAAAEQLVSEGVADGNRLALYGYSYGGFAVAQALSTTDRVRAAVIGAPITDFPSYFGTADNAARFMGSDLRLDPKAVSETALRSPIARAAKVRTPTLLIQGMDDNRCPAGQSEEFFAYLLESGVECELLLYPEASHKFTTSGPPSQRLDVDLRTIAWFEQHCVKEKRADHELSELTSVS